MANFQFCRALRLFVVAFLAGCLIGAPHKSFAQDKTVQIGFVLELSGKFVSYGAPVKRGSEMAIDAFNQKAGPYKVEALYRDVQSDTQATVSAMTELTQTKNVRLIVGPVGSPIVASAIPVFKKNKPVWLVPGSSSTKLEEEAGQEPSFFHTFPYAYHYHTSEAAALKKHIGGKAKRVAVIYSDDSYGRTHLPYVEKFYPEQGFEIVAKELVRANATDMNPALTKIALSKPDILLGLVQTTDAVTLAKQIHTRKLNIPYLVGTAYTQLDEWQAAVGEAQEGWLGVTTFIPGMERPASKDYPNIFPKLSEWSEKFKKRFNAEPDFLDVGGYATTALLLLAIEKAGSDDPQKVAEQLKALDVATILGRGKFVKSADTLNQAFIDMVVFQRQGTRNVLLYPDDVVNGEMKPIKR